MKKEKIINRLIMMFLICFLIISMVVFIDINASNISKNPSKQIYEMNDGSEFYYADKTVTDKFSYGASEAGLLTVKGSIDTATTFRGKTAYGVSGPITITYQYNNSVLQKNNKDEWIVGESGDTYVAGYSVGNQVGKGVALIQSSTNATVWQTVGTVSNLLDDTNEKTLFTINAENLIGGIYYRVIVAYEIKHKTGTSGALWWKEDVFDIKECVEVSEFYICYEKNEVTYKEVITGNALTKNEAQYGFNVNKNGSNCRVDVKSPSGTLFTNVKDGVSFTEKGSYKVTVTTNLGRKFNETVTVTGGLILSSANGKVYETKDLGGYVANNDTVSTKPTLGGKYSNLSVAIDYDSKITLLHSSTKDVFGVRGSGVYLMFKLNPDVLGNEWTVQNDSWGTMELEKVNGIFTGTVGTGALILQKSTDGINWKLCDTGIYKDGVFTTDYENSFNPNGDVCIYTPKGEEVLNGVSYRVIYAYEVKNKTNGQVKNITEVYELTVCNGELGAITFGNLTVKDVIEEQVKEDDESILEIVKKSETLINNSVTVTGFEIDTSLNPTVTVTVLRNSKMYQIPKNNKITENGKYDITIANMVGEKRELTIYVCKQSYEELYELYFSKLFITGKRIFSENKYPVYEGGLANYSVNGQVINMPIICGYIENTTTGKKVEITQGKDVISNVITEAGTYKAVFNTNSTFNTETPSGDNHTVTFSFTIIPNGTAPGPVKNQQVLEEHCTNSNVSNKNPIFYGVTYSSASKGNITLAFADEKSAFEFAYNYEKGMVEIQEDGSYRYTGSLIVSQKEKYNSNWDVTDAITYFAKQAVQTLCFDMSDSFTYATLSDEIVKATENLRTLELLHSVVVFANAQEAEKLTQKTSLPILNSQPYYHIIPGQEDKTEMGYRFFRFVKDENGYDSHSVEIVDKNGKVYPISYNESVEEQLARFDLPTGIVTINEKTVYGDSVSYKAIYIKKGDVNTQLEIVGYNENNQENFTISQKNNGESVSYNAFSLSFATDEFDPYTVIKVELDGKASYCTVSEIDQKKWTDAGEYTITVASRLGNYYKFYINVEEYYYSVDFAGDETDKLGSIMFTKNDTVNLPVLEKYGYHFLGYADENGKPYNGEIAGIILKGAKVLESVWKAKEFEVTLIHGDEVYAKIKVEFGKDYDLPVLEKENGEFLGWNISKNSTPVRTLTINEEGNITMFSTFDKVVGDIDTSINTDTGVDTNITVDTDTNTNIDTNTGTNTDTDTTIDTDNKNDKQEKSWQKAVLVIAVIIFGVLSALFAYLIMDGEGCEDGFLSVLFEIIGFLSPVILAITLSFSTALSWWAVMLISAIGIVVGVLLGLLRVWIDELF